MRTLNALETNQRPVNDAVRRLQNRTSFHIHAMEAAGYAVVTTFGADPTGARDSTPAFQDALDFSSLVYVPPGDYLIETELTSTDLKHLVLDAAHISFDPDAFGTFLSVGKDPNAYSEVALTADAGPSEFDRGIIVDTNASTIVRGDYVYIYSETLFETTNDTYVGEINRVSYYDAGRHILLRPLRFDYTTAATAIIRKIDLLDDVTIEFVNGATLYGAGVTRETVSALGDSNPGPDSTVIQNGFEFSLVKRGRIIAPAMTDFHGVGITLRDCIDCTIENPRIRNSVDTSGYGVSIENASDNCWVVGGGFDMCRHAVAQGTSSNVNAAGLGGLALIGVTTNCGARGVTARMASSYGDAFSTHAGCMNWWWEDCTVEGFSLYGFLLLGAGGGCKGCRTVNTSVAGIVCENESNYDGTFILANNTVIRTLEARTYLALDDNQITGFFQIGERVTQATSGAVGYMVSWINRSGAEMVVVNTSGTFNGTNTLTGLTSGATAVPTSVVQVGAVDPNGIRCAFGASPTGFNRVIITGNHVEAVLDGSGQGEIPISVTDATWVTLVGNMTLVPDGGDAAVNLNGTFNGIVTGNTFACINTPASDDAIINKGAGVTAPSGSNHFDYNNIF
jgi:hypothetical protein